MKSIAMAVCCLFLAAPAFAQTFTVSPVTNCPHYTNGYNISLLAGTYHIEWVSGAWSPFPDDSYQAGYTWKSQVQVYIFSTAQGGTIGSSDTPGWYTSYELAEAAAQGIYVLNVPSNSVVSFHIAEVGPDPLRCEDNRGSVTLRFVAPVATEPTTWGKVKALYR